MTAWAYVNAVFLPSFYIEPSHTQVLEWRKVRAKLRRFEQACSNLILGLLQRLVMKAIHTLELGVRRALKEAAAHSLKQREGFLAMREEITRQPYTQAVLDRLQFTSDEYFTDEVGLLELQAGSFSKFLSNVDLGELIMWIRGLYVHYCTGVGGREVFFIPPLHKSC